MMSIGLPERLVCMARSLNADQTVRAVSPEGRAETRRILAAMRQAENLGLVEWRDSTKSRPGDWWPIPQPVWRPPGTQEPQRVNYARAALAGMTADLITTDEGLRNNALFAAARRAGQMVAAGWVDTNTVTQTLTDAGHRAGLKTFEARSAVKSGLRTGLQDGPLEVKA